MSRNKSKQHFRTWIGMVIFVLLLLVIGVSMKIKLEQLTKNYELKQLTNQAKIQAQLVDERLSLELDKLDALADMIGSNDMDWTVMEGYFRGGQDWPEGMITYGIMELDGKPAYGEAISVKDYSAVQDAFHGNSAVSYSEGKGMVFCVPVFHDVNVRYVLYKMIRTDILNEYFSLEGYGEQGHAGIITRQGEIIFENAEHGMKEIWELEEIQDAHDQARDQMAIVPAISVTAKVNGEKSFFYVSEIGQTDFLLVGNVPQRIVSEGVDTIGTLIVWVFGLLMLLFVIGVCYLISEEEKIRESEVLREEKIAAENANKAKSDFLANMSHEIRTPINAVMGMNEMILRESEDKNILPYAQDIQSASQNLLSIINDILDFSKIEAGKMEIVDGDYEVSSVLNNVVNMISLKAEQKGLVFETHVEENIPTKLYGDPVRIQQVMVNLLNNAVKYTDKGKVIFTLSERKREEGKSFLYIEVRDTGIGIKEEDISLLFESFQRVDLKKNRSVEGTGLGLAITAKLVKQMKGSVNVESVYGEGSVFSVNLPQTIVDDTPIGDYKKNFEEYRKNQNSYQEMFVAPEARVLVVDDNGMNRQVARNFLKKTQIQVELCASGQECLELMQQKHYDVIFLDHMMPGMDGIETLHKSKELDNNQCLGTPMIALTANAIVGVKEMYLSEGFDDYLSKPIESRRLEKMLIKYLPEELVQKTDGQAQKSEVQMQEAQMQKSEEQVRTSELAEAKLKADTVEGLPESQLAESDQEKKQDAGNVDETPRETEKKVAGVDDEENLYAIDHEAGLAYSAGSEEMYQMLLGMYVEEAAEHSKELTTYYEAKDWKNYAIIAHAVKSTSKTIGAINFSEKAKEQEFAGKEERAEDIQATFAEFMEQYGQMVEHVKALVE